MTLFPRLFSQKPDAPAGHPAAPPSSLRRRIGLALAALFALGGGPAWASDVPKAIRIGAPDQGVGGKSFAGASAVSRLQAKGVLEKAFAADQIAVQWSLFKGAGPAVNEGLATEQLDVVFLGDLAGVIGRANGLKTRLIAAATRGANSYLAVPLGSEIRDFGDLRGKRVAILRGTAYQLPFDRLLKDAGLTEKDIRFVNLDWPTSKAALVTKDIDASVGGADLLLLKEAGQIEIATSTKGLDPKYAINGGLIVREAFARQYPAVVQRLVTEYVRQSREIADDDPARREALFDWFSSQSGVPVVVYKGEFEGTSARERFSPLLDPAYVAHYRNVIEGATEARIIRRGFDVEAWVDPTYVNAAVRSLGLDDFWTRGPLQAGAGRGD